MKTMHKSGITWNSSENEKCCTQKSYRKSKYMLCSIKFPPENRAVHKITWGKNTQNEVAFPPRQW